MSDLAPHAPLQRIANTCAADRHFHDLRDIKLSRGGHLMHRQEGRVELHRVPRELLTP